MPAKDIQAFRALHARDRVLLLPNAWDAASAALARSSGAEAIATTSAGVAWACGYPDGDFLPHAERLFALRGILRCAGDLPVTVDFEGGYSNDPKAVAELALELRSLGACGINIEDGEGDPAHLERKIAAIKSALHATGDDIFINARTDVYLFGLAEGAAALKETIERAKRYQAAGADGIFAPAVSAPEDMRAIAAATPLPLNLLAIRGLPTAREMYAMGVRRLSAGGRLAELAYGSTRHAIEVFLETGDTATLYGPASSTHSEMNSLFSA